MKQSIAYSAKISAILIGACLLVSGFGLYSSYTQERRALEDVLTITVRGQAAILEQVFAAEVIRAGRDQSADSVAAIRSRLIDSFVASHPTAATFGRVAAFGLGELRGDTLVAHSITPGEAARVEIPLGDVRAGAMQRALRGESGAAESVDARGVAVLAAYVPIPSLHMGLVAKIDLAAARAPYVALARWLIAVSVLIALLGIMLVQLATRPLVNQIQRQNDKLRADIVRRNKLEHALAASYQSYRALVENINDVAYEIDTRGIITYASPVVTPLLGYDPSELTGISFEPLIHIDDRPAVQEQYRSALQGDAYQLDFRIRTSSGEFRWVRSSGQQKLEGNVTTGIRGILVDVSQRKTAELALQRSERVTRAITTAARDGVIMIDSRGRVTFWNPAAESILGYRADEAMGQPVHGLIATPDYNDRVLRGLGQFARDGSGWAVGKTIEFEGQRKDGSQVPVELSLAVTELDGEWHAIGIVRDITDRKHSETALREGEVAFRTSLENMLDGFAILKAVRNLSGQIVDFEYTYINDAGCRSNQRPREAFIGHRLLECWPEHRNTEIFRDYCEVADHGSTLIKDSLAYEDSWAGTRQQRVFEVRASKLGDGMALTWRDITERKRVERALQLTQFSVDRSADAVLWMRPDGSYLYANDAACKLLGYSRDELLSMRAYDIARAHSGDKWAEHWAEIVRRGSVKFETQFQTRGGREVPVEITANYVSFEGQEYNCAIVRDLTRRKRAEAALQTSEARYGDLFANMMEGIAFCRGEFDDAGALVDWVYVDVNPAFSRITRLTEVAGRRVSDVIPGLRTANPGLFEICGRIARAGGIEEFAMYIEPLGLRLHVTAYSSGDDHFVAVFEDVTERDRAERALRAALDSLQLAKESAGLGVWELDLTTQVVTCDERIREMWGLPADDNIPFGTFLEHTHPLDREATSQYLQQAVQPGGDGQIQFEFRTLDPRDQRVRWVSASGQVHAIQGVPQRIVGIVQDITARKESEAALRDSEEKFRSMAEHVIDVLFMTDPEGRITYESPSAVTVFDTRSEEKVGTLFTDWLPPEAVEPARARFIAMVREHGTQSGIVTKLRRADGTYLHADLSISTLVRDGRAVGTVGIIRDVTERNRSQERLRKLEAAVDKSGEVVFMTDPQGIFTYVNPAFTRLYGYTPDEVIGIATPRILKGGQIAAKQYNDFWSTLLDRRIFRSELTNRTRSGRRITVEVSVSPTINSGGEIEGFLAVQRDITDRKASELALRESETKFRSVIESLNEGLSITDGDGRFVYLNRRMAEMCGYSVEELVGAHRETVIPRVEQDILRRRIEARAPGASDKYELQLLRKDGSTFWAEIKAAPYLDSQGRTTGTLAAVADISDRKLAEAERVNLESQLRQAQKMEAIGTLAGGIAHDFNNILTPIMAYTDLILARKVTDPVTSEDLQRVMQAATRARDLVRQILAFSRQTEQERFPMSPAPIIKEALKLIRASLPSTIQIQERIRGNTRDIIADPTQIHQVIMNLSTNAAWAMRERGGDLDVSLEDVVIPPGGIPQWPDSPPGNYACLAVRDSGCGMSEETVARIFDPFFTTKAVGEGTGLGLPVVHGIVKACDGQVYVHSAPGTGTTFELLFPQPESAARPTAALLAAQVTGSERILLVDDEPEIAAICARSLEQYGYQVATRTSSTEALEAFRSRPDSYDLLITDYTMPHLTGTQLAMQVRELKPDFPVIMMTGFSASVGERNMLEFGIAAIILKPVIGQELAATVRHVIDERRLQQAALPPTKA